MAVKYLYFFSLILMVCNSLSVRLKGVAFSRMSLYPVNETFTCFDGSATVPFSFVNDDYCDCLLDGSDEPGTSACPNSSFHCDNVGYEPQDIASSRVNDNICDCCDGSDEYESDQKCDDVCFVLGKAAREEAERKAGVLREGNKIRQELVENGKEIKKKKQEKLTELAKEKTEAEILKEEKDRIKEKAEEAEKAALSVYKDLEEQERKIREEEELLKDKDEAAKVFFEIDKNGDGKIILEELKHFTLLDQDNDGSVSENEIKVILNEYEEIDFDNFFSNGWTHIKEIKLRFLFKPREIETLEGEGTLGNEDKQTASDPAVLPDEINTADLPKSLKKDVQEKADKLDTENNVNIYDYGDDATNQGIDKEDLRKQSTDKQEEDDSESKYDENTKKLIKGDTEDDDDDDDRSVKDDVEDVEDDGSPEDDEDEEEIENQSEHNQEEDKEEKYDEDTKMLIKEANVARTAAEEADRNLRDITREINQIEESLGKHYGRNEEFAYMDGECYEYTTREYIYKLCPFDQVSHRQKSGGPEIRLGTWGKWEGNNYDRMLYTNGQSCWNGPSRITWVKILCGLETEVISASEPMRCEYELEFKTPAACILYEPHEEVVIPKEETHHHEEL